MTRRKRSTVYGDKQPEAVMYWRFARKAAQAWPYGDSLTSAESALLDRVLLEGNVIDLGCGVGRAFSYFLARTMATTGVDVLDEMLSIALTRRGPRIDVVKADIRQLSSVFRPQSFRNAICIGNTVSGLLVEADRSDFLNGVYHVLKCPGVMVVDFVSAEQVRRGVDGISVLRDDASLGKGAGALFRKVLSDGTVAQGYQYYWDVGETVALCERVGFRVQLSELPADVPRTVAICRKVSRLV